LWLVKEGTLRVQRDAALTDELTGALTRRGFFAAAKQLVAQHAKNGQPVSVLMFDLDHFKSINDRSGHLIGDEALKLFVAIPRSTMRTSDISARFGGEEFVAMLPCSLADAAIAAERVRKAFEAAAGTVAGCPLAATVSAGGAGTELCAHVAALLTAADQALYRAEAHGRNRVECVERELPIMLTRNPSIVRADDAVAWHVDVPTASAT
jgi:diguanylate cyclase (GGDEF)-like protein